MKKGILIFALIGFVLFSSTSYAQNCNLTISPQGRSHGPGTEMGSFSVSTLSSCSWTVMSTVAWITITSGGTGSGNWTVNYSVFPNLTPCPRVGAITIGDQTFTVTQEGISCTYSVSPTYRAHGSGAETGGISVATSSCCGWAATSNVPWITITSGGGGSGDGTVSYSVSANSSPCSRAGTMTIAGVTFSVMQEGAACTYSVSPTNRTHGFENEEGSVSVTASSCCAWAATSNASWITIISGGGGSGNGTVIYSVLPNDTCQTRTGTLTVAGQAFTIIQSSSGGFSIDPSRQSFGGDGGAEIVNVQAGECCFWTASTDSGSWDWIGISSGWSGTGDGTVNYYLLANNTGAIRKGMLTVAGLTFPITQQPKGCAYSLSHQDHTFTKEGSSGSVSVTAGPNCPWTAETNSGSWDWIGISSGRSGTGIGTVNYFLLPNNSGSVRTGTLMIAGQKFLVTQLPDSCNNSLTPVSQTFGAGSGSGSVSVLACPGSSWTASTNSGSWDWIGISSGWSGTGNGTVNYFLLPNNTDSLRTGTLTISGKTFIITQQPKGCTYSVSPNSETFNSERGAGSVDVTAGPNCPWTTLTNSGSWDWIGIDSGWSGTGDGVVNYFLLPNNSGKTRAGTLTLAGQTFVVTQAGRGTSGVGMDFPMFLGDTFGPQSIVIDIGDTYPDRLSYEVSVKIDTPRSSASVGFVANFLEGPLQFNSVYFNGEDGRIYLISDDEQFPVDLPLTEGFSLGTWMRVRIDLDFEALRGKVTIDDRLVRDSIPISPKDATWGASHFRLRKIGMLYSSGDGVSFGDFSVK